MVKKITLIVLHLVYDCMPIFIENVVKNCNSFWNLMIKSKNVNSGYDITSFRNLYLHVFDFMHYLQI